MKPGTRRTVRRWAAWFVFIIILMQGAAAVLPRELSPPAPLSWVARIIPAAASGMRLTANWLGGRWDRYWANVTAAQRLEAAERENDRLRFALLDARRQLAGRAIVDQMIGWTPLPWQGAVARVAFHDPADRFRTLWIAGPSGADLRGQAVVAEKGLVGRVVRRNGRFGEVLLVQDVESAVDVVTADGIRAIVRGTGGDLGRLSYVPRYEPITVGDTLLTSGRDGAYPGGLPVGRVASIDRDPERLYLEAEVVFGVRPDEIDWVRTVPVDFNMPERWAW